MGSKELESKVQKKMMNTIKKYDGYVYKNAQNIYTERGRPDLTACIPVKMSTLKEIYKDDDIVGIYVSVEVKRDKDTYDATEAQEVVGRQIQKAGGIWVATDDPDLIVALMIALRGSDAIQ